MILFLVIVPLPITTGDPLNPCKLNFLIPGMANPIYSIVCALILVDPIHNDFNFFNCWIGSLECDDMFVCDMFKNYKDFKLDILIIKLSFTHALPPIY